MPITPTSGPIVRSAGDQFDSRTCPRRLLGGIQSGVPAMIVVDQDIA